MKLILLSAFVLLATLNRSCDSVEQGIAGKVLWLEGDFMPTIGEEPEVNRKKFKKQGVERTLHIHELTNMEKASSDGPFFHQIETPLVKKVETNKEGEFAVSLPPGKYSVFVEEEQGLFANFFDGEGNINPVKVKEGEITPITIEVNYKATY